jgi:hypothetical protein
MESLWSLITIVGPLLLIAALVWAYFRNRNASRASIARAERGAREVRREIEEEEARTGAP